MDQARAQVISKWLLATRGEMTQDAFLEDLAAVTGWKLKRSSLSKYENARAVPWPDTLAKFERYARERGLRGPDFTPPAPAKDPIVVAMLAQAKATQSLADELRTWRMKDEDRIAQLEAWMDQVLAGAPGARDIEGAGARPVPRGSAG